MLVEALLPEPGIDPTTVRETVEQVLDRPEYQRPGPSRLERAAEWVFERLRDALGGDGDGVSIDAGGGGGGALSSLIGWAIIIAAAAFVIWLLVRMFRGYERTLDGDDEESESEPRRPAAAWHAEADEHERAGRWRDAVRCRYRAVVAELAGKGLVQEIPGRTAGDFRSEVARRAPAADPAFSEVTRLFQVAWYGSVPTAPEDAQRARSLAADTLASAGSS